MAISPDHKNALVQSLVPQSRGAPSLMAEHIAAKQEWSHPNTTARQKQRVADNRQRRVSTIHIGGRLPTYRFITRNSAMIAAWFVVIE